MTPIGLTAAFEEEWREHHTARVTVAARSRGDCGALYHGWVRYVASSHVVLQGEGPQGQYVIPRDEIQAWAWSHERATFEQADNFAGYARWGC